MSILQELKSYVDDIMVDKYGRLDGPLPWPEEPTVSEDHVGKEFTLGPKYAPLDGCAVRIMALTGYERMCNSYTAVILDGPYKGSDISTTPREPALNDAISK